MFDGDKDAEKTNEESANIPLQPLEGEDLGDLDPVFKQEQQRRKKKLIPREKILKRALLLWDRDGQQEGRNRYYLVQAERQLKAEARPIWGVFVRGERGMEAALRWFKGLAFFDILQILSSAGLLIAVGTFVANQDIRHDQDVFTAWQTITSAAGTPGNGGRKEAIEFLLARPYRFPWFCREGREYPTCIYRQERQNLDNLDVGYEYESEGQRFSIFDTGTGAVLAELQAKDSRLLGANLKNAKLSLANLEGADLSLANLEGANLWFADLEGANLGGSNDSRGVNLKNANLSFANLKRAYLGDANLEGALLISAKLAGAQFYNANLRGALLVRANIAGASFYNANLEGANLGGANLEKANLEEANLEGAFYSTEDSPCPGLFEPCPTIFPRGFDPIEAGMVIWPPEE